MGAGATANMSSRRQAIFLVALMCTAFLPLMAPAVSADGRDASITVTPIPTALEVNPGEAGEYIIRVRNTGSDPVTVSLSSAQEPGEDCNGYSSAVSQIPGPIDAGSYEEATLNVTLTQTAEGSCDTTVTVNAQLVPPAAGQPASETATVTTTAGDGSGSALFGVDLIISETGAGKRSQTWAGETEMEYRIEVENTGQTNETVNLVVNERSDSGCGSASDFDVQLSDTSVNIDQEESVTVYATMDVADGQAADTYCWEIVGTVANDPTQEAKDTENFELTVPLLKECTVELSKSSVSVNPDATVTVTATYLNAGNTEWTVTASASGSKSGWVSVDGASSGVLPYNNGEGERTFDFEITPDDSVTAGTETVVKIVGKDGGRISEDCQADLRIIVGQSRGASISVSSALLSNIEPGSNKSTTLTITNTGNGQDNLRIASSIAPNGWAVQLETSSVSVGSRHGNEKTATVDVTVRVPTDALATEEITLTFSVLPSSGGTAYDTVDLRVTVAAVHGMDIETPATDQTGRSGTEVRFPIVIHNEGNVKDTISLSVVSQTASPAWGTSFERTDGLPFNDIEVEPQSSTTVYLVVSIDGEEELENSRLTVRVRNKDDPNSQDRDGDGIPDNQRQGEFLAILSDRNFSMDLRLENTETATTGSVVLPPSGEHTFGLWLRNTGDGNDKALFTLGGLEGIATRSITAYGLPVGDEIAVPKGYGIWDLEKGMFVMDASGEPYMASTQNAIEQKMVDNGLLDGYQAKPYEVYLELTIRVNPGAQTGQGGVLEVLATSVSNAVDRSGLVTLSLDVMIVYDLEFPESEQRQEMDIVYGEKASVREISVVNSGNIRAEIRIFASENLRGWSVVLDSDHPECREENNDLLCMADEGEQIFVNVTVRAPYGAEMDDLYKFTVSAEPTETGVLDRQNIEFAAQGMSPEGVFGLAPEAVMQAAGVVLVILALLIAVNRRT